MASRPARAKKEIKTKQPIFEIKSPQTHFDAKENQLKMDVVGAKGDHIKENLNDVENLTHIVGSETEKKTPKRQGTVSKKVRMKNEKSGSKPIKKYDENCASDDEKNKGHDLISQNEEKPNPKKGLHHKIENIVKGKKKTRENGKRLQNVKENVEKRNTDEENDNDQVEGKEFQKSESKTTKPVVEEKIHALKSSNESSNETLGVTKVKKIKRKPTNNTLNLSPDKNNKLMLETVKPKRGERVQKNNDDKDELSGKEAPINKGRRKGKKEIDLITEVSQDSVVPLERATLSKRGKSANKKEAEPEHERKISSDQQIEDTSSGNKKTESKSAQTQAKTTQAAKGKRGAPKQITEETAGDSSQDSTEPPTKKTKTNDKKPLKNKSATSYESIDFSNSSTNSHGQSWNLKICSWNVDGIRAWLTKGGLDYIKYEKPDILCLQEVKCAQEKLPKDVTSIPGYHPYWLCSDKDGYAGVGIYTTQMAISVQYGLQDEELDSEGRIITAEYEQFYLISTYVPNAGRKLVTLPKKLKWNEVFHNYVKELDAKKPVIICGDMNVAHNEIDLANPKTNKKNAGFTTEERQGMTALLNDGFVDTFRHLNPDKTGAYTFWTYMMNSRAKNVGWRLDYMIVSERLLPGLCDSVIRSDVYGSDHCPIALFLHLTSIPKIPSE